MWPDPFDPKRRQVNFMKGTPMNVYSFLVPATGAVAALGLISLLPYIPYVQRKVEKLRQAYVESRPARQAKAFESDALISTAIHKKRIEHEPTSYEKWLDMN